MPFFLIVPVWLFFVLVGLVLLIFPRHRRLGLYAILISTVSTLTSVFIFTAVLYFGFKIGTHVPGRWFGVAVMGGYLLAIGFGLVLGAITGFFLTPDWPIDSPGERAISQLGQMSVIRSFAIPVKGEKYP
jgi:hypothetical protein